MRDIRLILIALLVLAISGCTGVGTMTSTDTGDACRQTNPVFTGYPVSLIPGAWSITSSDKVQMTIESRSALTVSTVTIDWEDAGEWTWTGSKAIDDGETVNITVQGDQLESGTCVKGNVEITYRTEAYQDTASGSGYLQGKVPG